MKQSADVLVLWKYVLHTVCFLSSSTLKGLAGYALQKTTLSRLRSLMHLEKNLVQAMQLMLDLVLYMVLFIINVFVHLCLLRRIQRSAKEQSNPFNLHSAVVSV